MNSSRNRLKTESKHSISSRIVQFCVNGGKYTVNGVKYSCNGVTWCKVGFISTFYPVIGVKTTENMV